jgi:hypothetical protein
MQEQLPRTQGCDLSLAIPGFWIPAQIRLERICINPKGVRQDSLT